MLELVEDARETAIGALVGWAGPGDPWTKKPEATAAVELGMQGDRHVGRGSRGGGGRPRVRCRSRAAVQPVCAALGEGGWKGLTGRRTGGRKDSRRKDSRRKDSRPTRRLLVEE